MAIIKSTIAVIVLLTAWCISSKTASVITATNGEVCTPAEDLSLTATCQTDSGTVSCATQTSTSCSSTTQHGQQCVWPFSFDNVTYTKDQCSYIATNSSCPACATQPFITDAEYDATASSTSNWDYCACCGIPTTKAEYYYGDHVKKPNYGGDYGTKHEAGHGKKPYYGYK